MKRLWVILFVILIFSCEDKKDTTPPEVTITSPTNGSKVNEVVTVSCMSTDNKEVSKVELWVDGVNTGLADETEPYSFQWNTTTYKDGDHTLIVRGYDTSDNEGDSPPITVKVDNTISVPTGVSVKSVNFSNGEFSIDWSKSTDGDFKSYTLEHSIESQMNDYEDIFTTEDVNVTNTRMENVSPLTYHYFRVTVTDTFLYQTKGSIYSTSLDPIPDSVDVKSVTYDLEKMTVEWEESKESDFGSYKLLYSKTESGDRDTVETYTDKNTTSYSTTTYDPTIENWYWVIVSDTLGQSKIGNGKTNTIDTPPSSINIKSVTYDLEKMIVEWDGSSDWDFKEFKLLYSLTQNGNKDTLKSYTDINTTSYITTTFDPTRENWYFLEVVDYFGQSSIGTGKTNTIDSPPKPLNIKSVYYDLESLTVEWEPSSENDFKHYKLLYSKNQNGSKDIVVVFSDIGITSFSTSNFDPTIENWYWIQVTDKWSQASTGDGKTNVLDPYPKKLDISLNYNPGEYLINWSSSLDQDFLKYELYVSFSENMLNKNRIFNSQQISDTTFSYGGIGDIQKRFFQLSVTDFFNQSTLSDIASTNVAPSVQTVNVKNFNINFIEKELRPYYKWGQAPKAENYEKDVNGIILWYGYYHPVLMSTKALNYLTTYQKNGDEWFFNKSIDLADKIIELAEHKNDSYYFPYTWFKIGHNEYFYPNWYSGMAQGRWLSYFSQLYLETKNEKYKNIADKIYISLSDIHPEPNVTVIDKENNYWIEEYPNASPSSYHDRGATHVLNGFVFAIWGLYDYYWIEESSKVKKILQATLTTLYNKASDYRRINGNSFYCLKHQKFSYAIASNHYHDIHIKQLNELYKITGDIFFKELSNKFASDKD